jgi:hypothetical protein
MLNDLIRDGRAFSKEEFDSYKKERSLTPFVRQTLNGTTSWLFESEFVMEIMLFSKKDFSKKIIKMIQPAVSTKEAVLNLAIRYIEDMGLILERMDLDMEKSAIQIHTVNNN